VDPSKSGQWWNGGWQRWGNSEWEGDKSSNIRSNDRGSVTLIEKNNGHWIENDVCEKPIDILENGVFLWTETKGTGHAFVSIHKEWNIDLYTYGRYGTPSSSPVGDGVLVYHRFDKAREYYQQELYRMNARAFKIMDVDESIALAIFQKKWLSSSIQPTGDSFKESGRVVDKYDLTGNNCSTTSINALKMAGTKVFETTLNRSNPSMIRALGASSVAGAIAASVVGDMTYTEDFVIPSSLERHMSQLASSSNMLVVEVTSLMKSAIPNTMGKNQIESTGSVGETLGAAGYGSGYVGNSSSGFSPGTTGGILGGSND
jgi:hypothetical protein